MQLNFEQILDEYRNVLSDEEKQYLERIRKGESSLLMMVYESEYSGVILERKINQIIIAADGFIFENISGKLMEFEKFRRFIEYIELESTPIKMAKIQKSSIKQLNHLSRLSKKYNNE